MPTLILVPSYQINTHDAFCHLKNINGIKHLQAYRIKYMGKAILQKTSHADNLRHTHATIMPAHDDHMTGQSQKIIL